MNAVFFIRPTELLNLQDWSLYEYLMIACSLSAAPLLIRNLSWKSLLTSPMTVLVFTLMVNIALSAVASGRDDMQTILAFAKVMAFFCLCVSLIQTIQRLNTFVIWLAVFLFGLALSPVLNHLGYIQISSLTPIIDVGWDNVRHINISFIRLAGAGTFHDPNDLCHILSCAVLLGLFSLLSRTNRLWRLAWLIILCIELYAIELTQSRGGMISLIAGVVALLWQRFGWKRTAIVTAVLTLIWASASPTRQTELSTSSDTAQERVQLWGSALLLFAEHPLLGVGPGALPDRIGHVAHNSFLQCFAELGWVGGTAFIGAFALSIWMLLPARQERSEVMLMHLRPFLLATIVAYIAGMMSLTHSYEIAPFLFLAMAACWYRLAAPKASMKPWPSGRFVFYINSLSVCFLAAGHVFVRATFRT